jgi:hypothetical protein
MHELANLFIKDIDPKITPKEMDDFFKKWGVIISSSLKTNEDGHPSYGYV